MLENGMIRQFSQYLIPQLTLELIEFCIANDPDQAKPLLTLKYALASTTSMIDLTIDAYAELHPNSPSPPMELITKRDAIKEKYAQLSEELGKFVDSYNAVSSLLGDVSGQEEDIWELMKKEHGFEHSSIDRLHEIAQFSMECGKFDSVDVALKILECLISPNDPRMIEVLWGKLAVSILLQDQMNIAGNFRHLAEYIEKIATLSSSAYSEIILDSNVKRMRLGLCHWAMFVFLRQPEGLENLIKFFMNDRVYFELCLSAAPYMFKYVSTAAIIQSKKKHLAFDGIMALFDGFYGKRLSDPVNLLLKSIRIDYDFEKATILLSKADKDIKRDYFLASFYPEFMNAARVQMFEMFCKLHQTVSMNKVASLLNLSRDQASSYITELLNDKKLSAHIDMASDSVCLDCPLPDPYKPAMDRIKHLTPRVITFTNAFDRRKIGRHQHHHHSNKDSLNVVNRR